MADTVVQFACLVPAGTQPGAPVTFQCQLGDAVVDHVEVEVPTGCLGSVGFFIASSLQQVIPFRSGMVPNWLVTNGRTVEWSLTNQPTSGDWQLVAYNTGTNPHTLTARFQFHQPEVETAAPPISIAAIEGA